MEDRAGVGRTLNGGKDDVIPNFNFRSDVH